MTPEQLIAEGYTEVSLPTRHQPCRAFARTMPNEIRSVHEANCPHVLLTADGNGMCLNYALKREMSRAVIRQFWKFY